MNLVETCVYSKSGDALRVNRKKFTLRLALFTIKVERDHTLDGVRNCTTSF